MSQRDPTCTSGCCISLLTLLLAAGQTSALISSDPNGSSHFNFNLSENKNLQSEVRSQTGQNNIQFQDALITNFTTDPLITSPWSDSFLNTSATWDWPRAPNPGKMNRSELRVDALDRSNHTAENIRTSKPNPDSKLTTSKYQKLILVHFWINLLILINRPQHPHLAFWFPHITIIVLFWMIQSSATLETGKDVLCRDHPMILHTPSKFQGKTHQAANPSPLIWLNPAVWLLILKSRKWLRKTSSPFSTSHSNLTRMFHSDTLLTAVLDHIHHGLRETYLCDERR